MAPKKHQKARQCEGKTKAGRRCRQKALPGQAYCRHHQSVVKQPKNIGTGDRDRLGQFVPGNSQKWKPGQSGNPKGRPPNKKYISDLIREKLQEVAPMASNTQRLTWGEIVANAILANAAMGSAPIIKELLNRIEGVLAPETDDDRDVVRVARFVDGEIITKAEEKE